MRSDYFLMGDTISDRTNRITLIKLVAQKLNIDRAGQVDFYLLGDDVVIRKGDGEYNPNNKRQGFYMGSSVVDKDNRITIIKLVVQNLQIKEEDKIQFFLHDDEVILRKVLEGLRDYNPEETSKECHEAAAWIYVNYSSKIANYLVEHYWEKPDDKTIFEFFKETKEKADTSKLTDADLKRLPFEISYIAEQLGNNIELAKEYNAKYSEEHKEGVRRIEEIEKLRKEIVFDSDDENESSVYTQPITMPKKSAIRKLFSKRI